MNPFQQNLSLWRPSQKIFYGILKFQFNLLRRFINMAPYRNYNFQNATPTVFILFQPNFVSDVPCDSHPNDGML